MNKFTLCSLLCTLFAVLAFSTVAQAGDSVTIINVSNFKDGETIRYSTPLLKGTISPSDATTITLVNESSKRPSREMTGQAANGAFKVLADLVPGENKLTLKSGRASLSFTLTYKPQTNPYIFRAVYFTDNTGDASYLSPDPNDKQDITGKMSTAMLLMQSFTAEAMNDKGYGRKTFNLELDADGRPKVYIVKGPQAPGEGAKGRGRSNGMSKAIEEQAGRDNTHYLVVLGKGCGYTAVGGGNLALMGGSCIYSWPESIQTAQASFMDTRPIDPAKFHIDSAKGNVYFGNTSTCLGACLHEIVHTFGVPHSLDGFDIMTRGFDHFNRAFAVSEPASSPNDKSKPFSPKEEARFSIVTAANLNATRYLALDNRPYSDKPVPTIAYDAAKNEITVSSELGIAFVGLEVPYAQPGAEYCLPIDPKAPAKKTMTLTAKEWERFKDKPFQVRVIDVDDNCVVDRDPLKTKTK